MDSEDDTMVAATTTHALKNMNYDKKRVEQRPVWLKAWTGNRSIPRTM